MHIKMIKTTQGADDGIHVKHYMKDESYTVGEDLGKAFVDSGAAEEVSEARKKSSKLKGEDKALDPSKFRNKAS